ncbi:MAG: hypothetical protein ACJ74M_04860 [Gaiellaceae bacterium]|jgi:hypothetical protein
MNREQRRHPEKESSPRPPEEKELVDKSHTEEELSVRAKSQRHKKVTADKWNQ